MLTVPFQMQPANEGTGLGWLVPLLVIVTFIVVTVLLRFQAARRKRLLPALIATEGAQWAALCRVLADGRFLDRGRARRGGGPRGTLLSVGNTLQWRPDTWESRQGNTFLSWPATQVRCLARARRRDITGISYDRVELLLPDGSVVFGVFAEHGQPPAGLNC